MVWLSSLRSSSPRLAVFFCLKPRTINATSLLDPPARGAACFPRYPARSGPLLPPVPSLQPHESRQFPSYGRIDRVTDRSDQGDLVANRATLHTSAGPIVLELFPNHAPKTVRNFVELATGTREYIDPRTGKPGSGPYFDGTIAHRVIAGFMVQMGDPTGTGRGGPGYTFDDEFHPELSFDRPYLLAMANAGPKTNGSQFFITVGPTP